jgi:hypothetical protein
MRGKTAIIMVFLGLSITFSGMAKEKPAEAGPFGGALFRTLFNEPMTSFRMENLNGKAYGTLPDTLKARLASYMERYSGFHSRLTSPETAVGITDTPESRAVFAKKQSMERAIVSLSNASGIEDAATAYVARAVLFHNWESRNEHILAEAVYAERYLDNPSLRPYLLLFLLHRYRCAYEYSLLGGDVHEAELISQRYRKTLQLSREHPDPLVRLMAEDLDRFPKNFLVDSRFTKGDVHP